MGGCARRRSRRACACTYPPFQDGIIFSSCRSRRNLRGTTYDVHEGNKQCEGKPVGHDRSRNGGKASFCRLFLVRFGYVHTMINKTAAARHARCVRSWFGTVGGDDDLGPKTFQRGGGFTRRARGEELTPGAMLRCAFFCNALRWVVDRLEFGLKSNLDYFSPSPSLFQQPGLGIFL